MEKKGRRRAMIVAGEASADLHAAKVIREAKALDPDLSFFGVGGETMVKEGCEILIPAEELSVMGLVEVLGHFPVIWRAFQRLKKILHSSEAPDVLVLLDMPDFNLRLANEAKKAGVPVLYFISPQVWAWRQGRVKKIASVVDRLATIFPFEPLYYKGLDIDVEYVGHPLLDEVQVACERQGYLNALGIDPSLPVVGLFPGSRRSELRYNLDTLVQSAQAIQRERPEVSFLLPVAPTLAEEHFEQTLGGLDLPVTLVRRDIYDAINACDAILTVSGTVTLQIALVGTPMAICYKMAPLSYAIGRRLVRVSHIGLANVVAGRGVVREFIQDQATPEALAGEVEKILLDEEYNGEMRRGLAEIKDRMGEPGCSERVALMASEMSRQSAPGRA
nr:lipid-A-disaccharide synthase [Desulfuromonas sp.]